ncbi:MAG: lysine exporter LysO family protein [Bacteroidales bacterium]|nr:lysine exporter LysO family protein [Bacteroidales bacterium]
MRDSLIIVGCFIAGVIVAVAGFMPEGLPLGDITTWGLYLLLFCVGLGLGMDETFFRTVKEIPLSSLLLPLYTVVGSLLGGLAAWLLVELIYSTPPVTLLDTAAVSSGFGYYSLSSVFLDEARGPFIATIALAANLLRELLTLLFAPLIRKGFGPFSVISAGGATSMDTTLPAVVANSGNAYAAVSVYHGFVLTVAVPFIVTFFISLY